MNRMTALCAALAIGAATLTAQAAWACGGHGAAHASTKQLTVDQLAAKLDAKEAIHVFDANSKERFDQGHIPTATWVDYKALTASSLPESKDAALVFYCAMEQCTASQKAAEAAMAMGYTQVHVLPAGIKGWEAAGKPVERTAPAKGGDTKRS